VRCANLLIGHDLSPDADLLLAALLRRDLGAARVHVVHVLPWIVPVTPPPFRSGEDDEARRASAEQRLREALAHGPWAGATVHVGVGDPATRIVALAEDLRADLIALACHGRRGLEHLALGSVTEHVVRFSPCPVLVLPDAALAAERAPSPEVAPMPDPELEDEIEALGVAVADLVARSPDQLSALQIGLPEGADPARVEQGLVRWLADAGIGFVDVAFARTIGARPRILRARFEALADAP
jgi:nucleotide-binding universal stress UspA family protein